jgi:hypothetical protein
MAAEVAELLVEVGEPELRHDEVVELVVLRLRLRPRAADEERDARHDLQAVGLAPVFRQAALEVVVIGLRRGHLEMGGIDHVGALRRDLHPLLRGTRLHQDRAALRRALDGQRALDLEVLSLVEERVHLRLVEQDAAGLVEDAGILLPAVPEALHHLHELGRALVAEVVFHVLLAAEVAGLDLGPGGHDVPARAAAAEMVQRGPFARDVIGLVVGGGGRRDEADMRRHRGERREQRQRLQLEGLVRALERAGRRVRRAEADAVGQEDHVDLRLLGGLGDVLVVAELRRRVGVGGGVPPGRGVVAEIAHGKAEADLLRSSFRSHRCVGRGAAGCGGAVPGQYS